MLTRQLGVTAYRKRLERLKSKNPFQQQFTLPEVTSKVQQSSLEPSTHERGHHLRRRIDLDVLAGGANVHARAPRPRPPPRHRPPPPSLRTTPRSRPRADPAPDRRRGRAAGRLEPPKERRAGEVPAQRGKADGRLRRATEDLRARASSWSRTTSARGQRRRSLPGHGAAPAAPRLKVGEAAKLAYAPETTHLQAQAAGDRPGPSMRSRQDKRGKRARSRCSSRLAAGDRRLQAADRRR